jgi:hypothetical protein
VAHFNEARDASCTFCIKAINLPAEKESFQHFFWNCPTTRYVVGKFFDKYINIGVNEKSFFLGINTQEQNAPKSEEALLLIMTVFKYALWQFKIKKKIPTWHGIESEFLYIFSPIFNSSKKLRATINGSNWFQRNRDI